MDASTRALVSQAVGGQVLVAAATTLNAAGIALMPLKGVWLQACAYPQAGERAVTDVDVLVPEADYARALALLEQAGWRRVASNVSETALQHDGFGLPLDLHRRLFTRGAFQLSGAALFARGVRDRSVFGTDVMLPDPRDVLAHLIGHTIKSRRSASDPSVVRDLSVLAARHALDSQDCAAHLVEAGMARAARYALGELARHDDAGFFAGLLRALPADPVGGLVAELARRLAHGQHPGSRFRALPGFLLDRSLAAGVNALLLRVGDLPLERSSPTNPTARGL